jgi:hypothetical protein
MDSIFANCRDPAFAKCQKIGANQNPFRDRFPHVTVKPLISNGIKISSGFGPIFAFILVSGFYAGESRPSVRQLRRKNYGCIQLAQPDLHWIGSGGVF